MLRLVPLCIFLVYALVFSMVMHLDQSRVHALNLFAKPRVYPIGEHQIHAQ